MKCLMNYTKSLIMNRLNTLHEVEAYKQISKILRKLPSYMSLAIRAK